MIFSFLYDNAIFKNICLKIIPNNSKLFFFINQEIRVFLDKYYVFNDTFDILDYFLTLLEDEQKLETFDFKRRQKIKCHKWLGCEHV